MCPDCKSELTKMLNEIHANLHAEMQKDLLSPHGIVLSAQMYIVEYTAHQCDITLEQGNSTFTVQEVKP